MKFKKGITLTLLVLMGVTNIPFDFLSRSVGEYFENKNIVDTAWRASTDSNVVDNFIPLGKRLTLLRTPEAEAAVIAQYTGGLLVYADDTAGTPKYKVFDDTTGFGIEQSASSVGASAINWIRVAASPTNDEWIIATRDAANVIKAQVCTGVDGGVSCGTPTTITATAGTHGFRNYDVAYEQTSGDALLVYGTATIDALRKIEWTGGAWTLDAAITTTRTAGTVEWVELTSRPGSNQIGIAYSDDADDVSAYRWDGTTAANEATAVITATAVTGDVRKFDVSFEGTSGDMLVVAWVAGAGTAATGQLVGTTWTIGTQTGVDMITGFVDVQEPNPSDNNLAVFSHGTAASANPGEGFEWSGTGVVDGTTGDDVIQNWAANYQLGATAYLSTTYYAVTVHSSSATPDDIDWWTMNSAGAITDQAVNARTRGASNFIDLFDYPNLDKVLLFTSDANSDLWADTWDGSAPSATVWTNLTSGGALETLLSTATKDVVDFAFRLAPPPDTTPPTPNPMTFASAPNNTSATQIDMTATTATDATTPPVSYYFALDTSACTPANVGTGAADSGWQSGTTYSDIGLSVNQCYGYKVKARDSVGTPNETGYSGITTLYTSANTPGTPTLGSPTVSTLNLTNAENSNPTANPTTNYAVQVVTTTPSDATWLNQWVDATGNPSASAVWLTDAQLDALVLQGLQASTLYGVKVKARNNDTDETALSAEGQGTTSAPPATLTISQTAGAKVATKDSGALDQYAHDTVCTGAASCAAFTLAASGGAVSVSQIKITESGSVTANTELSDINLYYDTDGNWSDAGAETLFGTSATFAADQTATITGTLNISLGQTAYVYVRYDLANGGTYPIGGATVNFQIAAATDVVSDGTESGTATLAGTTTIRPVIDSYTNSTESGLNYAGSCSGCGARIGPTATSKSQTVVISGKGFGTDPGSGSRDTATNKVEIGTKVVTDNPGSSNVTTWSNASITITTDTGVDSDASWGANYGGTTALKVTAGGQTIPTNLNFYVFPQITSITTPDISNAAREADSITLNGTRFGSSQGAGTVTIVSTAAGAATSWNDTAIVINIPTAISDTVYTGNIDMTQGTGANSKTHTSPSTFRILPRIISTGPVDAKGTQSQAVTISGNHFCQDGTANCGDYATDSDDITFNGVSGKASITAMSDTSISVSVPGTATDGNLIVTSDSANGGTTYTSNSYSYNVKFGPSTPSGSSGGGSNNPSLSGSAFSDGTDGDSHSKTQWQVAHNSDGDWSTPEWVRTTTTGLTSATVDTSDSGTFQNGDSGQTSLDCATTYKGRVRYMDNGNSNADTQTWEWSTYSVDYTFSTASCGPDATSVTNNTEGGLTDGGRIGHTIVISGTGFGAVSDGNQANCVGSAGTGCVKIGGTGGQIVADANISSWTNTSITLVLSSSDLTTAYGGATTNGLIAYAAGVSDGDGLTFYVYPDITSLTAPLGSNNGVREYASGDTEGVMTITGNKFGTAPTGGQAVIVGGTVATFVADGTCDAVDGWSETCIKIQVPTTIADGTDSGYIVITQGTGSGNKTTNGTDAQAAINIWPRITTFTTPADAPDSVSAWQASSVTINGSHFGAYNGTNSRVSFNGSTVDPGAGGWGVSAITLTVPSGATNNGVVQMTRGDTNTSNNSATFYVLPKVTSTGPTNAEAEEGGAITITGDHLCGTCTNLPTVRFYNASQTVDVTANSGATATSLAVTVPTSLTDTINSYNLEIIRSSTGGQDDSKSSANSSRNNSSYTILPSITSVSVCETLPISNNAREYSGSDSVCGGSGLKDGEIHVNGKHLGGSSGSVSIHGTAAPTFGSWSATLVGTLQVPTGISDSSYTGNLIVTRTGDSKTDTLAGFRVLPRITSLSPASGILNDPITVIGNHLCQSGTCPGSFSYVSPINNVLFGATNANNPTVWSWGHGDSSTSGVNVKVPSGSGTPAVKVVSEDYESNTTNFTYLSTTPNSPAGLTQYKSDGVTVVSTGGLVNGTTLVFEGDLSAQTSITMALQVEVKAKAIAFDGVVTATSTGSTGSSVANKQVSVSGLTDGTDYHWRARAINTNTYEASAWVAYGDNPTGDGSTDGSPANIDFYLDATGPVISSVCAVNPTASSCDSSQPTDIQAQIRWSTNENATRQVAYGTSCGSGADAATVFTNTANKQPSSPSGIASSPHGVILSGLTANTTYYYKIRSSDTAGNISYYPSDTTCNSFGTTAPQTRIMKTLEFFIDQATTVTGSLSKTFDVFISESKADRSNIYIKSVLVDVFGTSVGDGAGDITVTTNLNSYQNIYTLSDPGANKAISWKTTYATSTLNFDCVYCTDNASTNNTLTVTVAGPSSTSLLGAKAIMTYYYEPL